MVVILLVVDSLRADAPGFAGGEARTPTLDALARQGASAARMIVSGAWTIPSILSMLSGAYPHRLGVARWRHPFPARQPTLLSALEAAGFQIKVLGPNPRWFLGGLHNRGCIGDSEAKEEVLTALSGPKGGDRFILVHHWWTHLPYVTQRLAPRGWLKACDLAIELLGRFPEKMAVRFRGLYHRALEHFSEELLPRYLEAACAGGEDVLLILTSDHGENWGECLPPGRKVTTVYDLHGRYLADQTLHVPFLVWRSRSHFPEGAVCQGVARGVDVAPTIAALAGIPWPGPLPIAPMLRIRENGLMSSPPFFDGASFAAQLLTGDPIPVRPVMTLSSHNTFEPQTYPVDGRQLWRLIGQRTDDGWVVLDGPSGEFTFSSHRGLSGDSVLLAPRLRAPLIAAWKESLDCGELLEESLFPASGRLSSPELPQPPEENRQSEEAVARSIGASLEHLGYLEP